MKLSKLLKIAYISDQQYPIEKADSEQVVNTVSALTSLGIQIDLVIPRKWRNLLVSSTDRQQQLADFYHLKNGLATRELLHLPESPLRVEKYSHGLCAPVWARLRGYDVVYTRNPLPAFWAGALRLKLLFETYRVHQDSIWIRKLVRLKSLLGIITHSIPSKESLIQASARPEQVTVIHNGFNPELFRKPLSKDAARARTGLPKNGKFACYTGRLDREKGIDYLIQLAGHLPEVTFLLIGKTQKDPSDWIECAAQQRNLFNVQKIHWMTTDKMKDYLFASDILLVPPTSAPLVKFGKTVLPMKLFLYLAAGRPIVAPDLPDNASVLNAENAILVEPDNLQAAEAAIRRVFTEREWGETRARRALADSAELTWEARARKIAAFLEARLQAQSCMPDRIKTDAE